MRSSLTVFETLQPQPDLHFSLQRSRHGQNISRIRESVVESSSRISESAFEEKNLVLKVRVSDIFSVQMLRNVVLALYALIFWIISPFQVPARLFIRSEKSKDGKVQTSSLVRVSSVPKTLTAHENVADDVSRRRALAVQDRGCEGSAWSYFLLVTSRGETLFTQSWTPLSRPPKAVIILLHGLNEHSGRYAHFAHQLNFNGYKVYGMDWIGHGGSDGLHGYVPSLDRVVEETKEFIKKVKSENPGLPCFLYGHSTGGSIVLKTALDSDLESAIQGVVVTSPAIRVDPLHPVLVALAPIIAVLLPRYQFSAANKEGTIVSRDPEVLKAKYSDPLVYTGAIRVRTGYEIMRICSSLQQNLGKIKFPFFVLHGEDDNMTDPEGSQELYHRASSEHKEIRLYKGLLHDLLFEPEKDMVMEDIVSWLDDRMKDSE